MEIKEITEKEYNKFIKNYEDSLFFQCLDWGKFKAKTNWQMEIVGLKDKNEIKGVAMLLSQKVPIINKRMYYCPRGFIVDYKNEKLVENFTIEIKKYLKNKKAIFLKINPYIKYQERNVDGEVVGEPNKKLFDLLIKLGYKHYGFYKDMDEKKDLEPRWVSVLDIDNDIDIDGLLNNMRTTTKRWILNRCKKSCITITEAKYEDLENFKKLMKHTADRREFEDRPLSYYQTMYKSFENTNILKILLASIDLNTLKKESSDELKEINDKIDQIKDNPKKSGVLIDLNNKKESIKSKLNEIDNQIEKYGDNPFVSAGAFLSYGDQVVFLLGASYKDFMNYGAQYLIQYEMIKYAIDNKFKKYNFYGIDGNFNKDAKNYGLFDFKRGFGADVVELIGEFDLPISKPKYYLYKVMFKSYKTLKKVKLLIKK